MTGMGNRCFYNCKSLKKVIFLGKPKSIGSYAFTNCTALEDIYLAWGYNGVNGEPWGATNTTFHYIEEGWMDDIEAILAT